MTVPALFLGVLIASFAAYVLYAGVTWLRYGRPHPEEVAAADRLIAEFMPTCEVAERHSICVSAPAEITFRAAADCDLAKLGIVQAIIRTREILLGADGGDASAPSGFLAQMKSLGWGVLAEISGLEVVMGAVTRPWEANVVFRALAAGEFRNFNESGYAKIAWTLRADPAGSHQSIARTETRVITTDSQSRAKFRRYWAFLSPGIIVIRWAILRQVKNDAERRYKTAGMRP